MFQLPPLLLQVSSLSRPLLVERVAGLVAAGDLRAPVLPALAVLQVGDLSPTGARASGSGRAWRGRCWPGPRPPTPDRSDMLAEHP